MDTARTREIALALTRFPSVTDTEGETRFAPFLRDFLASFPYFRSHPERLRLIRTRDDERERYALAAAAGSGAAVILTGHYDVVSTECYGPLEPFAFEPEELAPRLVAALRAEERDAAARGEALGETEARALRDLASGDFLPGRGLLDMKAGLAAGIAVLEDFAAGLSASETADEGAGKGRGAALFLAVPDEEGSSRGMLSALRALPELLAEWGLEARLAINLDAAVDQGDGEAARAAFLGSVGKLHPFALFLGRPSHAGAPFDGVNAALLAAEFTRLVECSGDLLPGTNDGEGEAGRRAAPPPPPTVLYARETWEHYDVTTPRAAFVSLNLLTHGPDPEEALAAVADAAREAMETALALLRGRAEAYALRSGAAVAPPDRAPRVLGWAELEALAREAAPAAYEAALARAREAARGRPEPRGGVSAAGSAGSADAAGDAGRAGDAPAAVARLAEEAARLAGLAGPAAVIGLAPPYYPRSKLDPARNPDLVSLIAREAAGHGAEGSPGLALQPYFPGISDMSHLSPADGAGARAAAAAASPLGLPAPAAGFSCPAINVGPWGREYHQRLERVHAGYAFGELPRIVDRLMRAVLAADSKPTGT